jgi:hypothetical protein
MKDSLIVAENEIFSHLIDALPVSFDFYGMGQVQSVQTESEEFFLDATGIAYRFSGDCNAWMILVFESTLDASLYSEVGNILASKTATSLEKTEGIGVMTSPPIFLNEAQLSSLRRRSQGLIVEKTYRHFAKEGTIPIQLLIFSTFIEETGHA